MARAFWLWKIACLNDTIRQKKRDLQVSNGL
jgi:hypothetical protein